jgi:hypothetical protein
MNDKDKRHIEIVEEAVRILNDYPELTHMKAIEEAKKVLGEGEMIMNKYKEKLIEMVDLAEKQVKLIKEVTGFSDFNLSPQLQIIREAQELLEKEEE